MINSFTGRYKFLSNFQPVIIRYEGMSFKSVEHAFQAAKTFDVSQRRRIRSATFPGDAKKLGRQVTLRPDWERVKVDIMSALVLYKFTEDPDLKRRLLKTGEAKLVEGNAWHDNFWGVCLCSRCREISGKNVLGHLLVHTREVLMCPSS